MANSLPLPPTEVPAIRTSVGSAPDFVARMDRMLKLLEGGLPEHPFEWVRTEARQIYLFGFGREYDDRPPRGKVTAARTARFSHHGFGGGCDVVEKDNTPWNAPPAFWNDIGDAAEEVGLKWGGRWHRPDLPHVYHAGLPADLHGAVGDHLRDLIAAQGIEAVWLERGMM